MTSTVIDYANRLNDRAMALYKPPSPPIQTILTMLNRAASLNPGSNDIQANLGLVNWNHGSLGDGGRAFHQALELNPSALNYQLLAIYYASLSDWGKAKSYIDEAIRLEPSNADFHLDRGNILLMSGDWQNGFAEYDFRLESKTFPYQKIPGQFWNGKDDLNHKTLFVQAEQGIGDHILFSRYLIWLKERYPYCRILFSCHPDLIPVFWGFRHVVELLPTDVPWPNDVDFGCFLLSLARHHGTTKTNIPSDPGFIRQNLAGINRRFPLPAPPIPSLKVAICWSGSHAGNVARNMPLPEMLRLAEDPRISLYSVQCDPGRGDIDRYRAHDLLIDLGAVLEREGWMATAAALCEFDVVITVCTAIAHLAGSLGLNCWTLLRQEPFWIWPRDSDTTVWYPSLRLFHQKRLNEWTDVIDRVGVALSELADKKVHYV